ncbi:MAG: DUF411 domain-containing protein [Sphingomonadaceae bacterium]|nr:DUF411 domain-containing protein [Sphingomonadaceae bacterium]
MIDRRSFIAAMPLALIACSAGVEESRASESTPLPQILVHKTPSCGCCNAWVDHLRAAGFTVETVDVPDTTPIANRLGVPDELRSCHTAEIDGYGIEGHVPAADIRRLLAERPDAAGLAVPGMPLGSPGMEMGDRRENYDVILFDRSGGTRIFTSY